MFSLILEADVAICDVTIHSASVFFELGIRHALRKKRTVLIRGKQTADATPFDILTDRYIEYDLLAIAGQRRPQNFRQLVHRSRRVVTDSPIFKRLPGLTESDISDLVVVPSDFGADVRRAIASKSKAWLGLAVP